ncbi:TraB/GumN family protein [Epibacterium sp. Ofav1-8]|uniref:TraB/GumN family protein n=1 Tax=Epibacterium sp. Ofav1-8 TaxID=2917735 RepID=UPI001EF4052D|nr:TraB/GumN family protein [Epibacterium sp. Ofav1-8]MCG7622848.1 TraB/GumN family protein [Epibacterium sp. Ofav1-8]
MRALVLAGLTCLAGAPLWAACTGTDLRETAAPALRAEVAAELAATPYAEGLSWIATRGERRLHIIGTMHLNDPRHDRLVQHMTPAIEAADAVLLEVNPADKSRLNRTLGTTPSMVFITEGPSLIDRMPADDWQQIADQAQAAGIPAFMAAKMRPWFLSMSLSVPRCARSIRDVTEGLDAKLMQVAEAAEVPMLSLEDPLQLFRLLDAAPLEEQVAELRSYIAMMGVGPDDFYTMVESYFDGAVQEYTLLQLKQFLRADSPLPRAEREAQVAELLELLLYQRNRDWIPVIEATEGRRLVVAVGAAHLPGDDGVLALLEAAGYRIEQVPL